MRYLGCKQKLLPAIVAAVSRCGVPGAFFDAYAGTGSVLDGVKSTRPVIGTDLLVACTVLAKCKACLTPESLTFNGAGWLATLSVLNDLEPVQGYIWKTFTPHGGRMYFTEDNGQRIDAMRAEIERLRPLISEHEHTFLLGCLIEAVSAVSNTSGTYGAYNKKWDPRSTKRIVLTNPFTLDGSSTNTIHHGDAKAFLTTETYDILYLDPPYNTRQYGSYYHVLETIVRNDMPEVRGVTGLRSWEDTKSRYCVRRFAMAELEETVRKATCSHVLVSYNNEGIMSKDEIVSVLNLFGTTTTTELEHTRYTSHEGESTTIEYLFHLVKTPVASMCYDTIECEDCLVGMARLPPQSMDMILCDLPYGLTECRWDCVIPLDALWSQYMRIIKPEGAIVLFAQQPFTSMLVMSNVAHYKYSWVWKKTKAGNFAQAPYRPLCEHEDILVFSQGKVAKNGVPRMYYAPQGTTACDKPMKGKSGKTHHREGRSTQPDYVQTTTNYPRSVLEFPSEGKPMHPTQKPLALCEYLVRTYCPEGGVVLDSCMGSGTTAMACRASGRHYVGYEKDPEIHALSVRRLNP